MEGGGTQEEDGGVYWMVDHVASRKILWVGKETGVGASCEHGWWNSGMRTELRRHKERIRHMRRESSGIDGSLAGVQTGTSSIVFPVDLHHEDGHFCMNQLHL